MGEYVAMHIDNDDMTDARDAAHAIRDHTAPAETVLCRLREHLTAAIEHTIEAEEQLELASAET